MELGEINGIAIKMRRILVLDEILLYMPVGVMKGNYNSEQKLFTDEITGENYMQVGDDYLNYSEDEYGYLHSLTLDEFSNIWMKDGISEKDAILNFYRSYKPKLFVIRYDVDAGIKSRNVNIESLLNGDKSTSAKVVNFIEMNQDQYEEFFFDLQSASLEKSKSSLEDMKKRLSISLPRLKKISEMLEKKLNEEDFEYEDIIDDYDDEYEDFEEDTLVQKKQKQEEKKPDILEKLKHRKEIEEYIKNIVIGQDEHVDRLTTEILKLNLIEKQNMGILLTGSTGVGKTKILSLLAKKMDKPFLIIDTTQLTVPGYVGKSIEDFLYDLYLNENKNLKRVEDAIIVFDEIDKKGSESNSDVSGKGVLNTLLKFLDGTYYTIKQNVNINTSNMTVIAAGAFSDVYKKPNRNKNPLGFGENPQKEIVKEVTVDDFIEKGGLPDEFMGRFPIFIRLNDLDVKDLKEILLRSQESALKKEKKVFDVLGAKLIVDDSYLEAIAQKAFDKKTGARALQSMIKETTWKPFNKLLEDYGKYNTVKLTKDTVYDDEKFSLLNEEEQNKQYVLK